jgi:MFS family permease
MRGMQISRARAATAVAFLTQGMVLLSLTTRLPDFQDKWHLSDVTLSLILLMMILLAGAGSVVAEALAKRRDSALLLRAGLLVVAVSVPVLCVAPTSSVYVAGVAGYGLGLGVVDASTNMQAVAIEHRYGRPILPSFHGAWTLGGILGATLTFGMSHLPLEAAAVVGVVPLVVAFAPYLPRDHGPTELSTTVAVPWRPILLVGSAMVLFYMVDTAATTWGPVYLDGTLDAPSGLAALATLPYLGATLLARAVGDRLVDRHGAVWLLRISGVVAAAALAVIVFAPTWVVAVIGFTLLGGAVATIAPLSFSAAGAIASGDDDSAGERIDKTDQVVARFNQFNYVGALLGAVLTGAVGSGDLRLGFAVPMVLVLGIIPLATQFAIIRRRGTPVDAH